MRSLNITDVRTTVVGTPWRELVFVELVTDEGLTGVGEVRMVNRTETLLACVHELAPRHVIGTDPFDVERLAWKIQRSDYSRPGEVTQSALAAFDIACWTSKGRRSVFRSGSCSAAASATACRHTPTGGIKPIAIPSPSASLRERSSNAATGR